MLFTIWIWCRPAAAFDCCRSLQHGKETQLLHVFEEHLILGSENRESAPETPNSPQNGIKVVHKSFIMLLRPRGSNVQHRHLFYFFTLNVFVLFLFLFLLPATSGKPTFSARFFLVVIEVTPAGRSLLHMWHLHLAARPVTMGERFKRNAFRRT